MECLRYRKNSLTTFAQNCSGNGELSFQGRMQKLFENHHYLEYILNHSLEKLGYF